MPRYQIKVGADIDVLNQTELENTVSKQTRLLLEESKGVKHIEFEATGTIVAGAVTIPSPNPASVGQLQIPQLGPEDGFYWSIQRLTVDGLTKYVTTDETVVAPAVPASGNYVFNPYPYPVTVVLAGFTATAVSINGLAVGTGNGTYTLPPGAGIAITYTVAGTMTWTAAAGSPPIYNTDFLVVYKNFAAGSNRLFSLSAQTEWEFPGSHAGMLKGGDLLVITGTGLQSTGQLTISGEALEAPAEMVYKLVR
jgi:hypothetical protein